ncbi:hypothetical protein WG904_06325 [Pedobacter sp. Du54]
MQELIVRIKVLLSQNRLLENKYPELKPGLVEMTLSKNNNRIEK